MKLSAISRAIVALALAAIPPLSGFAQQAPTLNLTQPGTEYSSIIMGTGPSMTVFNGAIWLAFMSNSGNTLSITHSTSGGAFTNSVTTFPNSVMLGSTAPAIVTWNGQLWIFYTGTDNYIYYMFSSNGVTFSSPLSSKTNGLYAMLSSSQPTLAVYNNSLWVAWEENESGSSTTAAYASATTYSSETGLNFESSAGCLTGPDGEEPQTGAAIGLSTYLDHTNGDTFLAMAFQAQGDWNHQLITCNTDGASVTKYSNPTDQAGSGVAATFFGGYLYWAYKELSGDNVLYVNGSYDDVTLNPVLYSGIKTNGRQNIAPATVVFNNTYYLAYTENSGTHHLWVATAPLP